MALLSLKVTAASSIAGSTIPGTAQVKSVSVAVPGQVSLTIGTGLPNTVVTTLLPPSGVAATDTARIATAAANGGTVLFADGTYKLNATISVSSNTTFESLGGQTTIDMTAVSAVGGKKIAFKAAGSLGTKFTLAADATARAYTATVSTGNATTLNSAGGVGMWALVMTQGANYYASGQGSFNRGEIKRIRAINTGTGVITFEEGLYDTYTTANSSQIALITPVSNIKFSGIRIVGSDTAALNEEGVQLIFVDDFAIEDCHFDRIDLMSMELTCATNGHISNCTGRGVFYDGVTGSDFYFIAAFSATQWVTISDCVDDRHRHLYVNSAYGDAGSTSTFQFGEPRFVTVDNCIIKNAEAGAAGRSYAYEHHGVGQGILLSNCVADSCDYGLSIKGGGISVYNFRVVNPYDGAIVFNSVAQDLEDILIDGVVCGPFSQEGGGAAAPAVVAWQTANNCVVNNVVIRNVQAECDFSVAYAFFNSASTGISGQNFELADWQLRHNGAAALGTRTALVYLGALSDVRCKRIKGYNAQALIYGTGDNCVADACELENASSAGVNSFGVRWNNGANNKVTRCSLHTYTPVRIDSSSTGALVADNSLYSDSGTYVQDLSGTAQQSNNWTAPDGVAWSLPPFTSYFKDLESLPLMTMPRYLASTASTCASTGFGWAGLCVAQATTTVSKIAICTGSSTPSAVTDLYFAICDASGNVLKQTSDVHTSITAANTVYSPDASPGTQVAGLALTSSQAITRGVTYYLVCYWKGTTFNLCGFGPRTAAMSAAIGGSPGQQRGVAYTGGATLPQVTSVASSANIPWLACY